MREYNGTERTTLPEAVISAWHRYISAYLASVVHTLINNQ